jgi:poly(3-hydroxybutyrate) depolymerase
MTTTVDVLSGRTEKIHHRGIVAMGVAAILAVGGVAAGLAVAANDGSSPATKPAHVTETPSVHAHPDPLVTRYGGSVPFGEQPKLQIGGPR